MTTDFAEIPSRPPSRWRRLARVAFIHGARAVPLGLAVGALMGWFAAQSDDSMRDTGESVKLTALIVGFILVPSAVAAFRVARSVRDDWAGGGVTLLLRRTAVSALAGAAWGIAGAALALTLGQLGALDLAAQPLAILGLGFGLAAGAALGLLVSAVRAFTGRTAESAP